MKESILPIDLDNLGFIKDDEYRYLEVWIYELENYTILVEFNNLSRHTSLRIYEPQFKDGSCIELPNATLETIKNLIKAGQ
jgi:hypothetical protein